MDFYFVPLRLFPRLCWAECPGSCVKTQRRGLALFKYRCIRSLTEPMLASTEGCEHRSLLPIIDVLDEILLPSPNRVACSPPNLQVSSSLTLDPLFRRKCLLALDKVCVTHRILPARYPSAGNLVVPGESPDYCGGLADVWRGEVDRRPVAVKVTRYYSTAPIFQAQERSYHEVLLWGRLSHPNILPFLGVDTTIFPLAMVSPWMQHGNLKEFLVCFPNASRLRLILGASRGLEYMHGLGYIHGDIKSFNVLVDDSHSACLADFGSSFILPLSEPDPTVLPAVIGGSTFSVRWLAPELVIPEKFGLRARVPSKESDVYSLAMLMYEAFSGLLPFAGYRDEGAVLQVISGARPSRPRGSLDLGLTDGIWTMMQECWGNSNRRWAISRIVSHLESSITPAVSEARIGPPTSAPQTDSGVTRPSRWKTLFRRLNRLFRILPIQSAIPKTSGQLNRRRL